MGLDAWAFSLPRDVEAEVDFYLDENEEPTEIWYWRKNWSLHQYLGELYFDKGGQGDFNCDRLVLSEDDLDNLEYAILNEFEYEEECPEDVEVERERDLNFVQAARKEIAKGHTVYYDSWY